MQNTCYDRLNNRVDRGKCGDKMNITQIIPLRAKRVGEFIEIRHNKISPTRILSTLGCLSLRDSVANKPRIISAACYGIGLIFFLVNYLFSLKNSRSCRDLNPGPPSTKPICYQLSYPDLDKQQYTCALFFYSTQSIFALPG